MNKFKSVLSGIFFSFHLAFRLKEGAKYSIVKLFTVLLNNIVPIIITIFPGLIVNELLYNKRIQFLVIYILVLSGVPLVKDVIIALLNRTLCSLEKNLSTKLMAEFYMFMLRMDYETLENPDLQEELSRARSTYTTSISIIDQVIAFFMAITSA